MLFLINLLQKRIVRFITKAHYLAHTAPLFSQLKVLDIFSINSFSVATFMYSYHHNLLPSSFRDLFLSSNKSHGSYPDWLTDCSIPPSTVIECFMDARSSWHRKLLVVSRTPAPSVTDPQCKSKQLQRQSNRQYLAPKRRKSNWWQARNCSLRSPQGR